ncbi:MAG: hypothetical protein WB729_12535 [Candidatus Sulfotelmatobacter sp.]
MRKLATLALLTVCAPWVSVQTASAQRGGGARAGGNFAHFSHAVPARGPAGLGNSSLTVGSLASRQDLAALRRLYRGGPYADLFSSLGFPSDYVGDPSTNSSPAAPNFLLVPSLLSGGMASGMNGGMNNNEDQPRPGSQPLMIELRGDRYVRVTGGEESSNNDSPSANYQQPPIASAKTLHASPARPTVAPPEIGSASTAPARTAQDLQPAVLVFRDGHTEKVRDYAITGGMLYARGDYYTDGYWTRTVALANLNIPATLASNADRGVKFVLPGAPNEVVTRP